MNAGSMEKVGNLCGSILGVEFLRHDYRRANKDDAESMGGSRPVPGLLQAVPAGQDTSSFNRLLDATNPSIEFQNESVDEHASQFHPRAGTDVRKRIMTMAQQRERQSGVRECVQIP